MVKLILEQAQAYSEGLMRWMASGGITQGDMQEERMVYNLLAFLIGNPVRKTVNSKFNGMFFEELCLCFYLPNFGNGALVDNHNDE